MSASDRDAQTGATRMRDEATAWQMLLALRRKGGPAACAIPPEAPADVAALVELYLPFAQLSFGRPIVVAHLGQSLDGRIATMAGASRWVTGEADLTHTHRMRALADAILVGAGTVRHDDPRLTVRRCAGAHPLRVVIDSERRLGGDYRLFQDGAAPTLVLAYADRVRPGERLGQAELVGLPRRPEGIAPRDIIAALAASGRHFLFIEGGGITISRFLMAGALDRLQITVAPVILGSGKPSLTLPEIVEPHQGLRPRLRRFSLGEDMLYDCILHD
jgi:diaminohydroxyphosphoribosylaminopyrimidine deaminase/5-amino-6-(5-phosphoribosylamino)uracil reductase